MLDFNTGQLSVSKDYLDFIKAEYTNIQYLRPRSYTFLSRYANTELIEDTVNSVDYHETYDVKEIPESNSDLYFTVDVLTENRLDIISTKMYGISLYWWIIAMANNIIDPFDIPIGTVLRIPQIASIYMEGSVLG